MNSSEIVFGDLKDSEKKPEALRIVGKMQSRIEGESDLEEVLRVYEETRMSVYSLYADSIYFKADYWIVENLISRILLEKASKPSDLKILSNAVEVDWSEEELLEIGSMADVDLKGRAVKMVEEAISKIEMLAGDKELLWANYDSTCQNLSLLYKGSVFAERDLSRLFLILARRIKVIINC